MEQIVYKRESIEMILRILDQIEIKGANNVRLLAVAFDKLNNEGKIQKEEEIKKEENTDGTVNSL